MLGGIRSGSSTTAIASLSISTGASAAQVIMTPGFWKKGSGSTAYYRTQMTLQGTIVKVSGTASFGLVFSTVGYDAPANMRLGAIACRQSTTLAGLYTASWTYGIQPTCYGETVLFSNLARATTYFIEWRTTHPCSDPVGGDAKFDTHEEPGDTNYSSVNNGFWNFTGFVADRGATYSSITLARTLKNVVIYADSNGEGRVTSGGTTPDYFYIMEHRNGILNIAPQDTPWDNRGALAQYEWLMLDSYANTNSVHWSVMNQSYGGCWQGKMSAARRTYLSSTGLYPWPGVWKDVVTRMKWRTNYSTTDFTSGSDWTGGWTPNLVWFASFYNDCIQQYFGYAVSIADSGFVSSNEKDNVGKNNGTPESLLHLAYTTWASTAVLLSTYQTNDAMWETAAQALNASYHIDTKTQIVAATTTDTSYYKISGAGGTKYDAGKGRYFDMSTSNATTGLVSTFPECFALDQLHPTYEQHVQIAAAYQSILNGMTI